MAGREFLLETLLGTGRAPALRQVPRQPLTGRYRSVRKGGDGTFISPVPNPAMRWLETVRDELGGAGGRA